MNTLIKTLLKLCTKQSNSFCLGHKDVVMTCILKFCPPIRT